MSAKRWTDRAPLILAFFLIAGLSAPAAAQAPRIVIVGIDEATQKSLGSYEPGKYRDYDAKLLEKLKQAGVRGVAFDIWFPENAAAAQATQALADSARSCQQTGIPVVMGERPNEPTAQILNNPSCATFGSLDTSEELVFSNKVDQSQIGNEKKVSVTTEPGEKVILVKGDPDHYALGLELAARAGLLTRADIESKAGELVGIGIDNNAKIITAPALRPGITDPSEITALSYGDFFNDPSPIPYPILKGALAFIGMNEKRGLAFNAAQGLNDEKKDAWKNPNPAGAPGLEFVPGIYMQAFALKRVLEASANGGLVARHPLKPLNITVPAELAAALNAKENDQSPVNIAASDPATESKQMKQTLDQWSSSLYLFKMAADPTPRLGFGLTKDGRISSVFINSPADKVGLQPGDKVMAINGQDVTSTPSAINAKIKDIPGVVSLTVQRGATTYTYPLERRDISIIKDPKVKAKIKAMEAKLEEIKRQTGYPQVNPDPFPVDDDMDKHFNFTKGWFDLADDFKAVQDSLASASRK